MMEATFPIRHAIELFDRDGDQAAIICAGGVLADILLKRRDTPEARRLIEEGLSFWRERGHARWIRNFEERAARLPRQGAGPLLKRRRTITTALNG